MPQYNNILQIAKIPIIGEIIISVAIYFILCVAASSMNYFGLENESRAMLLKAFLYISVFYVLASLLFRAYKLIKEFNQ